VKAATTASPDGREKAMFTRPCIGSELVRDRQREMLAYADQQRLATGLVKIIQRMTTGRQTAGLGAGGSAVHPKESADYGHRHRSAGGGAG
jgi:hypothetical protein